MSSVIYSMYLKRIFDLIAALAILIFLWPFMLIIYAILWFKIGQPVIFRQKRPGYMGRPFMIMKFRTMTNEKNASGCLLPVEKRVTRIGKIMRSLSLDELPEIFNVLKGDMSIVGPRPLLMQYLERYTSQQARRHDVLPGITGWAQINGRNDLTWEEKFNFDIWYVDHQSFKLDMCIIAMTFWKVFRREGINRTGYSSVPEFMGSANNTKNTGSGTKTN